MSERPEFKKLKKDELVKILEDHWERIKNAEKSISTLDSKVSEIESKSALAQAVADKVTNIQAEIVTKQGEITTASSEVTAIKANIEESQKTITDFFNELTDDDEAETKCIATQIEEAKDRFDLLLSEYTTKCKTKEEENSNKFSELLNGFTAKQKQLFQANDTEYKNLFDKIEKLLPSATSAGLASSYQDAQNQIKSIPRLWIAFSVVILGLFSWYAFFLIAKENHSIGAVLSHVLTGSPLIWLAWYLQRSISQQSRIFQEYNHKQRVMNLYEGFVKAIDESGTEEQKYQLLTVMLETVRANPANIMGGHETLLESVISHVKLPGGLGKTNKVQAPPKESDTDGD